MAFASSAPRILKQPEPVTVQEGNSVELSVLAEGDTPMSYAWYFEREKVLEAGGPTLKIDSASEEDAGLYWVLISNKWGQVGSVGVLLRVANAQEWKVSNGGNGHRYEFVRVGKRENDWRAMFDDVQASGGYLVSFQSPEEEKFVNTLAPLGVTRLIGLIQPPGSGEPTEGWKWMSGEPLTYTHWGSREPSNGGGVNERGFENLVGIFPNGTWNDIHGGGKAYIVEYPKQLMIYSDLTNAVVSAYESVGLRAGAASKRALRFQWFANGRALTGITGNTLSAAGALKNPGPYFFTVSDGSTTLTSATAEVRFGPLFTESPTNNVVFVGGIARFNVSVSGAQPFSFQWHRNRDPIAGETNRFLVLTDVTTAQAGSYWVEVWNVNAKTRSNPGELIVLAPRSQLILLDDFENGAHPGWSLPVKTVTPLGNRRLLGEFKSETVALILTNLPIHKEIVISCDVIVRGFWQGNKRMDMWRVSADGESLFETTFSTFTRQAFPDAYLQGENPPATGALETNTLGYELSFADNRMIEDARFRITAAGVHTNQSALLTFSSDLANPEEAGWSLDNVAVVTK
jgi:hypothetical protein